MKTLLLLCAMLALQATNSQNITFPDEAFKNKLLQANTNFAIAKDLNGNFTQIDSNNDNEISVTEALNISSLDLDYETIASLGGIDFFTNLKYLRVQTAALAAFNAPSLAVLEELYLTSITNSGALTSLDISANTNLKVLHLYTSYLELVDLSSNVNLRHVVLYSNTLTALDLTGLSELRTLRYLGDLPTLDLWDCGKLVELTIGSSNMYPGDYAFSSIDLSNQPFLANLNIGGTSVSNLDLSSNPNLENVFVSNNQLQTLNFGTLYNVRNLYCGNNQLTNLNANGFQNLEVLNCENNNLIGLSFKNFKLENYINFSGNPDLTAICCDPEQVVYVQNQALLNGNYDTVVNSSCSEEGILAVQNFDNDTLAFYPNPAIERLYFTSASEVTQLDIFDSNGRLVQSQPLENGDRSVDVSRLQSGIYLLKAHTASATISSKLVKR